MSPTSPLMVIENTLTVIDSILQVVSAPKTHRSSSLSRMNGNPEMTTYRFSILSSALSTLTIGHLFHENSPWVPFTESELNPRGIWFDTVDTCQSNIRKSILRISVKETADKPWSIEDYLNIISIESVMNGSISRQIAMSRLSLKHFPLVNPNAPQWISFIFGLVVHLCLEDVPCD